jgi:hypothetical protein
MYLSVSEALICGKSVGRISLVKIGHIARSEDASMVASESVEYTYEPCPINFWSRTHDSKASMSFSNRLNVEVMALTLMS